MPAETLSRFPLAVIVAAQFLGTSLWFSVNGVGLSLGQELGLTETDLGRLTIATQAGFILGTLALAATGLADRFRASRVFAVAAVLGALMNGAFVLVAWQPSAALLMRFATGLCLAGIYPLGMKLVISWTPRHTGAALSWLVGMLTLGTAVPHLLRGATLGLPWQWPLLTASLLALVAAWLIRALGDGPHLPPPGDKKPLREGFAAFASGDFRAAALGYFGHCWELYAFWTLTPLLVARELQRLGADQALVPWLAFLVIALGLVGCVYGGRVSRGRGSLWVARAALAVSGLLCLVYPLLGSLSPFLLLALLLLWGFTVIADSPQLSALAAATAPRDRVGSTLAVMNAIGFALTIPAIFLVSEFWSALDLRVAWLLLPGPVVGLFYLCRARL
ncbi:MAG TPA: MFS transporter [Alcanivorax sp.]|nr:MFS transporter [Alcanivorax sp.]